MSALVLLLVLTGCGGKKDTGPKKLVVYGMEGGYGVEGWKKVAETFGKKYDVEVELVLNKKVADELRPKLQAKEYPDVIYLAIGAEGGLTETLIAEKGIEEISDLLNIKIPGEEVTVKEKVVPGFFDNMRASPYGDGKKYLSPIFYSPLGMFYNKDLFAKRGWEIPKTWDEMWALGDKAKAENIALFTYPTAGYFDGFLSSLINSVAGPELYEKMMKFDLEAWKDPKVKEVFDVMGKLATYTHKNTVSQANGESYQKNQQLVMQDQALFIPNGTWLPGEMEKANAPHVEGFQWGLAPIPPLTADGHAYSSTFTEEVYIPKGAKNVDTAKQFIAYLYSDEAAKIFFENGEQVQPIVGSEKLIPEGNEKAIYYGIYANGAYANTVGFEGRDPVEGADMKVILFENIDLVVNGEKTVDAWYNEVLEAVGKYNK